MLKNYFKIAWRNLWNNKTYSLINIFGLTVGLSACLLVAAVVMNELSYDRQWKHAEEMYRMTTVNEFKNISQHVPYSHLGLGIELQEGAGLGPELKRNFPEVKESCRMQVEERRLKLSSNKDGILLQALWAERSVWRMLDLQVLEGRPENAIEGYDNIVLTESIRKHYFPNSNPIGQIIASISGTGKTRKCIITGVIKDIPDNTHLKAQVLIVSTDLKAQLALAKAIRNGDGPEVEPPLNPALIPLYILLAPGTDRMAIIQKINNWYEKKQNTFNEHRRLELQPFTDIYLRSNLNEPQELRGSIRMVYIFSGVSLLLLIIACINYVSLTTARSIRRIRDAGIHKILGAGRSQLIAQFLFESLLFFSISFALATFFYGIALPAVETYLGHGIALSLTDHLGLLSLAFILLLMVCLFTGLYPAYLFSKFKAGQTIKGHLTGQLGGAVLRKILVTAQFSISVSVIIVALVVNIQLRFLKTKDLGYDRLNLLQVGTTPWGIAGKTFKQELLRLPGVECASFSDWYPSLKIGNHLLPIQDPGDKDSKILVGSMRTDPDFASVMKLNLRSGRLFNERLSKTQVPDAASGDLRPRFPSVLVSESYAKTLGIKELDKPMRISMSMTGFVFPQLPVGVVKDFYVNTLLVKEQPYVIYLDNDIGEGVMLVRLKPGSEKQVIAGLQQLYTRFYPGQVLTFNWVDALLEKQYRTESRLNIFFVSSSLLIVFLACMGLFGLVAYTVEQRVKEVGIRKVLGASVLSIVSLISRDFLKLVLLAIIIASPLAWYFMNKWLQDYPYRIGIQWWMFATAGILAVSIALLTISFKAVNAAMANPVNSLRSE